jgi:hypothetical protein
MREADGRECEAFGRSPKQALRISLRTSLEAFTALDGDNRPIAMFGLSVTDALSGKATPWFLATDVALDVYARDLLTRGKRIIGAWLDAFPYLENYVAADNVKAIRLLRHWGAEIGTEERMIGGVLFVRFTITAAIQEQCATA